MAAPKAPKSRRQEVRKSLGIQRPSVRAALNARQIAWGIGFAVLFWALASLIVFVARSEPAHKQDELAERAVVARVDITWIDEQATQARRELARAEAPSVYRLNERLLEKATQLVRLPEAIANVESVGQLDEQVVQRFALDQPVIDRLKAHVSDGRVTAEWRALVEQVVEALADAPIITEERFSAESLPASRVKLVRPGTEPQIVPEFRLMSLGNDQAIRRLIGRAIGNRVAGEIEYTIAEFFLRLDEPSYMHDEAASMEAADAAAAAVQPVPKRYLAGQVLVPAGKQLDASDIGRIRAEQRAYRQALPTWQRWLGVAGIAGLVGLITGSIGVVVMALRRRIAENPMRGLAMTALLLATLAMAWLIEPTGPGLSPAAAVLGAMLAAVILTIAYDQRFAMAAGALHALLIALALQLSVGMYLVVLTACAVAIAQLKQIRQRGTLIRAGLVTGLVVAAGVMAAGLAQRPVVDGLYVALATEALWALAAAVVVGFFVLGVLPAIERTFKVSTAMTLLELSDVNQPLLRKLAQTAPGTYNHSLNIAVIAESAAESIGADGLLCRVGAYYHDIGKMNKPAYFIENQGGGPNRHEKLSPAMSLLIIVGHVKDGMEMAREYGLPRNLHHFIESHHGTTLVEYFYHAAQQQKGEGTAQPSEFEFRYPGPKPQTREAAILMLCDTVESASRTLADPTPSKLEQLVHRLAMKRLMDGQFDESNLTLEELHRVEEAITKSLAGIYHGRVRYPTDKPQAPPQAEGEASPAAATETPQTARPAAG